MNDKLFVEECLNKILANGLKIFPHDFIDESSLDIISIPVKTLVLGQEFFGAYEIITTNGDQVFHAATLDEAKFFIYSSKERNGKTFLPKDRTQIKSCIESYNKYLDNLLDEIKKDYKKYFPEGKNLLTVSNQIFQKLNLTRL